MLGAGDNFLTFITWVYLMESAIRRYSYLDGDDFLAMDIGRFILPHDFVGAFGSDFTGLKTGKVKYKNSILMYFINT